METMLLRTILTVVRSEAFVLALPLPPTVTRMRLLLALCGVSAATMHKYVIGFPLGTALFSMNLMVSVPVGISG